MVKFKAFLGSSIIGIGLGLIHYALPIVLLGVAILLSSYTDYTNGEN